MAGKYSTRRLPAAAALGLILLLALGACGPGRPRAPSGDTGTARDPSAVVTGPRSPRPEAAQPMAPVAASNAPLVPGSATRPQPAPSSGPPKSLLPPALGDEAAYGLESVQAPLLPEDPDIGPLADVAAPTGVEGEAQPVLASFLAGLKEGRLDRQSLGPGREALVALIARALTSESARPRMAFLGRVTVSGEEEGLVALARFSLLYDSIEGAAPRKVTGELLAARSGGTWGIESLSVAEQP